jgi:hypothetical protein
MPGLFDAGLIAPNEAANVLRQAADMGEISPGLGQAVLVLLDERDANRRALRAAVDMRQAQRTYFRTKDQAAFRLAKVLEGQFDRVAKE